MPVNKEQATHEISPFFSDQDLEELKTFGWDYETEMLNGTDPTITLSRTFESAGQPSYSETFLVTDQEVSFRISLAPETEGEISAQIYYLPESDDPNRRYYLDCTESVHDPHRRVTNHFRRNGVLRGIKILDYQGITHFVHLLFEFDLTTLARVMKDHDRLR